MTTIFSKRTSNEGPVDIVYKDDKVTAFRDINPIAPVHILIVPNEAIATVNNLEDMHESIAGRLMLVASRLAEQEGIAESGYRLMVNCDRNGGQVVFHLHMRLEDGRSLGLMVNKS